MGQKASNHNFICAPDSVPSAIGIGAPRLQPLTTEDAATGAPVLVPGGIEAVIARAREAAVADAAGAHDRGETAAAAGASEENEAGLMRRRRAHTA